MAKNQDELSVTTDVIFQYHPIPPEKLGEITRLLIGKDSPKLNHGCFTTLSETDPSQRANLSTAGLAFETEDAYEDDVKLAFSIYVPTEAETIHTIGNVISSQQHNDNRYYTRFYLHPISEEDKGRLKRYTEKLLKE